MDFLIVGAAALIGGVILGYTTAANMNHPINRPPIFRTIQPIYFILGALVVPGVLGFMSFGILGLLGTLAAVWIVSVIAGTIMKGRLV